MRGRGRRRRRHQPRGRAGMRPEGCGGALSSRRPGGGGGGRGGQRNARRGGAGQQGFDPAVESPAGIRPGQQGFERRRRGIRPILSLAADADARKRRVRRDELSVCLSRSLPLALSLARATVDGEGAGDVGGVAVVLAPHVVEHHRPRRHPPVVGLRSPPPPPLRYPLPSPPPANSTPAAIGTDGRRRPRAMSPQPHPTPSTPAPPSNRQPTHSPNPTRAARPARTKRRRPKCPRKRNTREMPTRTQPPPPPFVSCFRLQFHPRRQQRRADCWEVLAEVRQSFGMNGKAGQRTICGPTAPAWP